MGAVMICKNEPAETPYYIESMDLFHGRTGLFSV